MKHNHLIRDITTIAIAAIAITTLNPPSAAAFSWYPQEEELQATDPKLGELIKPGMWVGIDPVDSCDGVYYPFIPGFPTQCNPFVPHPLDPCDWVRYDVLTPGFPPRCNPIVIAPPLTNPPPNPTSPGSTQVPEPSLWLGLVGLTLFGMRQIGKSDRHLS